MTRKRSVRCSIAEWRNRSTPCVGTGNSRYRDRMQQDRAITPNDVIMLSIAVVDRAERHALGEALAARVDATPVHRVGKILILWRRRAEDS